MKIRINDTWTLTHIRFIPVKTEPAPGGKALTLSFHRNGHASVARTVLPAEQDLLLRIFDDENLRLNRQYLREYTTLRKLGLAQPRPDDKGRMILTPAGKRVAIWVKATKIKLAG